MTPAGRFILSVALAGSLWQAVPADGRLELDGHLKTRYTAQQFPDNSVFHDLTGSNAQDLSADTRLNVRYGMENWDLRASYQLDVLYGDTIEYTRRLPDGTLFAAARLPDDRRRLFDLTQVIEDRDKHAVVHRLDRASLGYTGEKTIARLGRQALTWGNGMVYTPMDVFNPFDPTAIDPEYKSGDDMFYGQYLRDNGDDVQTAVVFRRNVVTGDFETEESSLAIKYHGIGNDYEFDALAARHFGEPLLGIGGNQALGGAIWRGDLTLSFTQGNTGLAGSLTTDDDVVASLVTSLSYAWTWGGNNVSGGVEYFFNGFGQHNGEYDPVRLARNPALLERIARGELFTLGRHYVAASAIIEVTPLFALTPNLFVNLSDGSALLQLVTRNDLRENLLLLGALSVPLGPEGTEFGGADTGVPGQYLATDLRLFVQLAAYF